MSETEWKHPRSHKFVKGGSVRSTHAARKTRAGSPVRDASSQWVGNVLWGQRAFAPAVCIRLDPAEPDGPGVSSSYILLFVRFVRNILFWICFMFVWKKVIFSPLHGTIDFKSIIKQWQLLQSAWSPPSFYTINGRCIEVIVGLNQNASCGQPLLFIFSK